MMTRYPRAHDIEALTFTYTSRGWVVAAESRATRQRLARISLISALMARKLTALVVVALVHLAAFKWVLVTG